MNVFPLADPHAFTCHFSLINWEDLQKALRAEVFVNEADNQVRATHEILKYDPAHKSFAVPKYVIKTKDPQFRKITVTEDGFRFPEVPSTSEGVIPAGPSSSPRLLEPAEVGPEREVEVANSGPVEDAFDVFEQARQSEDPLGDLGDPCLTEADFSVFKSSSRHEMGYKKRPQPSLSDLIEGQPGKSKSEFPPPPKTRSAQDKSASTQSKLPPPPPKTSLPLRREPSDPKQKRDKGKRPVEERSGSPREEGDNQRPTKQLKIGSQGRDKQVEGQPEPQAWLPAPMLRGGPLREDSSLKDFNEGEGTYVADAVERCLLLPVDMAELATMRSREVFLCLKRYLGMVSLSSFMTYSSL